jgi:hypothetical protein
MSALPIERCCRPAGQQIDVLLIGSRTVVIDNCAEQSKERLVLPAWERSVSHRL